MEGAVPDIVKGAQDVSTLRNNVRSFVEGMNELPRFAWAFPTLGSTAEAVDKFLSNSTSTLEPEPCLFQAHLASASSLIDGCLARNDQIQALEGEALTTALDLLYGQMGHSVDLALARVGLKAVRKQAEAGPGDAGEDKLEEQFRVRADARDARIALHLQPGGPLNFKERIDNLRTLLADDIRSIRELLKAARIGMHLAGVAPNFEPVPDWKKDRSDNLTKLVNWCRSAIRTMEISSRKEVHYRKSFSLVQAGLVSRSVLENVFQSTHPNPQSSEFTDVIEFEIKPDFLLRRGPHRLINFGMAIRGEVLVSATAIHPQPPQDALKRTADIERVDKLVEALEFGATVRVPKQSVTFPGSPAVEWTREQLDLNGEIGVWKGTTWARYAAHAGFQFYNANPIGKWHIFLHNKYYDAKSGDGKLKDLFLKGRGYGDASWRPSDIVVFMTLASLQRS